MEHSPLVQIFSPSGLPTRLLVKSQASISARSVSPSLMASMTG